MIVFDTHIVCRLPMEVNREVYNTCNGVLTSREHDHYYKDISFKRVRKWCIFVCV